jgi:hypothetical protein
VGQRNREFVETDEGNIVVQGDEPPENSGPYSVQLVLDLGTNPWPRYSFLARVRPVSKNFRKQYSRKWTIQSRTRGGKVLTCANHDMNYETN